MEVCSEKSTCKEKKGKKKKKRKKKGTSDSSSSSKMRQVAGVSSLCLDCKKERENKRQGFEKKGGGVSKVGRKKVKKEKKKS